MDQWSRRRGKFSLAMISICEVGKRIFEFEAEASDGIGDEPPCIRVRSGDLSKLLSFLGLCILLRTSSSYVLLFTLCK